MSEEAMRLYLCGTINGCADDEAKSWRDEVTRLWQYGVIDPMARDYRGKEAEAYREIVDLDKRDVRECAGVIVAYERPSVGTAMKIFYAWQLGKPIALVDRSGKPLSPWLRYHSTKITTTIDEALDWFLQIL